MKKPVSPTQKALNLWSVILIVWAIYRAKLRMPEWFDEFIAKPLVFVLPVYYYIKKVEKKDFAPRIDLKKYLSRFDLLVIVAIAGVFVSSAIIANFIKLKRVVFFTQPMTPDAIVYIVLLALATGISEEILSRGFVLKRLYEESKNVFTSSFFASILFFFLHVPILFSNQNLTGNMLLMLLATDMILSLANSFVFLERKNLILPILIHSFYNLSIILFL